MTGLQRAVAAAIAAAGGQHRLGTIAGVSPSVISRIRRGRVGASPSMCVRLGIDPTLGTFEANSPESVRAGGVACQALRRELKVPRPVPDIRGQRAAAEVLDAGAEVSRAEIEAAKLALRAEQPGKVPTMIGRNDRWTRPGERVREPNIEDIIEAAKRRERRLRAWANELERAASCGG